MVLGNGTEEMTLMGTIGEFINGVIPISGQLADARDVIFSVNKGDGLGVVLSGIGLFPGLDTVKRGPKVIKKIAKKADEAVMAINKAIGTNITPKILDSVDEIAAVTKKGAKEFTEAMGEWVARNRKALSQLVPNSMIVSKMDEFKAFKQRLICVLTKGNCFVKGTLVKTEYGHKEIEKIEIGERVLSLNTENNKLEYKVVLNTLRSKTIKTILFEFEDNIIVETTPDHKFFVLNKGFVKAENMCENDIVLNNKFKGTRLNKINEIYYFEKNVYNLYVEDNNNYFVTEKGLLVHNKMMSYADIMEWFKQVSEIIDNQNLKFRLNEDDFKEALKACFTYKTLIYGKNIQKIGDVKLNDTVYSYNETEEKIEEKKVINVFKHKVYKILELFLENGEKIETTPEHPFYVNGNYIPAGNLTVGNKIFTSELKNIELIEKREIFYKNGIKVYNFEVEDNHNYFVGENKFLVHNTKKLFHAHNLDLLKQIDGIPYSESWLDNWIKTNVQKPRNRVPFFIIDTENPSKSIFGYKKGDFYMLSSNHLKTNLSLDEMNRTIDNFCFTAETYIFGKKIKLIKDINVNDEVYSYNEKNTKIELKKVISIFKHKTNKILELFLENGEKIETTPEHPFYVNGNYIPAGNLTVGNKIFTSELKNIELIEKRGIFYKNGIEVYNFEVEDNHNYFVGKNKILVHNTKEKFYSMENFNHKKLNNTNPKAETWFKNQKKGFIVPNEKGEWLYGWDRGNGDRAIIITNANGNAIFNSQLPALEIPGINGKTQNDLRKLYRKVAKVEKKSNLENVYFGNNYREVERSFENYGITGNHLNENYGTSSAKHGFNFPSKIEHNPDHLGVNHSGGSAQLNNGNK